MYNEALSRSFNFLSRCHGGENKIVETKDLAYRFVKILSLDRVFYSPGVVYIYISHRIIAVCAHAEFSTFFFLKYLKISENVTLLDMRLESLSLSHVSRESFMNAIVSTKFLVSEN